MGAARLHARAFGSILLGAGIVLLVAAITQYGFMFVQQSRLRAQWSSAADAARGSAQSASPSGPIRLIIPKIALDDIVMRGTSYRSLLAGPGWLEGTPAPGAVGNLVLAGHRDTFFRHVHQLGPGDEIILRRGGAVYRYRVTLRSIVKPSDLAALANTPDAELTLVTCYPTYWVGPAPGRLIVRAKLLAASAAPATLRAAAHASGR